MVAQRDGCDTISLYGDRDADGARGKPAIEDDFFGRAVEIDDLLDTLPRDNVLLLAPRRVGKTSVMHALARRWCDQGGRALFFDVQGSASEMHFARKLAGAIDASEEGGAIATAFGRLRAAVSRVAKVGGTAAGMGVELELRDTPDAEWHGATEALVRGLADQERETLLLVDELPLLVQQILATDAANGRDRAKAFLDALRRWRVDPALGRVHWLVAGSIGLDSLARRYAFSASINDFVLKPLGAFDDETARRLLEALAQGHTTGFETDARDHLVARVGWCLPYYLQLLFGEARALARGRVIDVHMVDLAWATLLDAHHRSHFDHWWSRLGESLAAPDAERAHLLLHALAGASNGVARDEARVRVMGESITPEARDRWAFVVDTLTSDGYLVEDGGRFRFRSPLLRDFWAERTR